LVEGGESLTERQSWMEPAATARGERAYAKYNNILLNRYFVGNKIARLVLRLRIIPANLIYCLEQ